MIFMNTHELIIQGKLCPYCHKQTTLSDSSIIYGKSYGMIYICFKCDAYVGCHKGTTNAKGSVANEELRKLRKKAHELFDPLWRKKAFRDNCSLNIARNKGYTWLSEQLGIPRKFTHIGMLNKEQCLKVISLCLPYNP